MGDNPSGKAKTGTTTTFSLPEVKITFLNASDYPEFLEADPINLYGDSITNKWLYLFERDTQKYYAEIYIENENAWYVDDNPDINNQKDILECEQTEGFIVLKDRGRFEDLNYGVFMSPIRATSDAFDILNQDLDLLEVVAQYGEHNGLPCARAIDFYQYTEAFHKKRLAPIFDGLHNHINNKENQSKLLIARNVKAWQDSGHSIESYLKDSQGPKKFIEQYEQKIKAYKERGEEEARKLYELMGNIQHVAIDFAAHQEGYPSALAKAIIHHGEVSYGILNTEEGRKFASEQFEKAEAFPIKVFFGEQETPNLPDAFALFRKTYTAAVATVTYLVPVALDHFDKKIDSTRHEYRDHSSRATTAAGSATNAEIKASNLRKESAGYKDAMTKRASQGRSAKNLTKDEFVKRIFKKLTIDIDVEDVNVTHRERTLMKRYLEGQRGERLNRPTRRYLLDQSKTRAQRENAEILRRLKLKAYIEYDVAKQLDIDSQKLDVLANRQSSLGKHFRLVEVGEGEIADAKKASLGNLKQKRTTVGRHGGRATFGLSFFLIVVELVNVYYEYSNNKEKSPNEQSLGNLTGPASDALVSIFELIALFSQNKNRLFNVLKLGSGMFMALSGWLDMQQGLINTYKSWQLDDNDAAAGHALMAVGGGMAFVLGAQAIWAVGASGAGAAAVGLGPLGWIAAACMIVGMGIVWWLTDDPFQSFTGHCFLGESYGTAIKPEWSTVRFGSGNIEKELKALIDLTHYYEVKFYALYSTGPPSMGRSGLTTKSEYFEGFRLEIKLGYKDPNEDSVFEVSNAHVWSYAITDSFEFNAAKDSSFVLTQQSTEQENMLIRDWPADQVVQSFASLHSSHPYKRMHRVDLTADIKVQLKIGGEKVGTEKRFNKYIGGENGFKQEL